MTKCNQCTGLACGDECEGTCHATVEAQMTNEKDNWIPRVIAEPFMNEKDREDARKVFSALESKTCAFGGAVFTEDEAEETIFVISTEIARIRSEAVQAERERCIVETMQLLITSGHITNSDVYNGFRARLSSNISHDQGTDEKEASNG